MGWDRRLRDCSFALQPEKIVKQEEKTILIRDFGIFLLIQDSREAAMASLIQFQVAHLFFVREKIRDLLWR